MNAYLSVVQSIYIIYMFNYFETDIYFPHPLDIVTNRSPLLNHTHKDNHICYLGNIVGFLLPIWLIGRHFVKNQATRKKTNRIIMNTILVLALTLNMNAFMYFLPVWLLD